MSEILSIYKNKKVNLSALMSYGFEQKDINYIYQKTLKDSGFILTVTITIEGNVSTRIIDPVIDEPYTLHLADNAVGGFIYKIKNEYKALLTDIADKCFEHDVFKTFLAKELINYAENTYGNKPEFLWSKLPGNAVLRRTDTGKWYGALLIISKQKLGFKSNEIVEIIDLRIKPELIEKTIDNQNFFPGYHMNKKSWCTIILDDSVSFDEICHRMDESYKLAIK